MVNDFGLLGKGSLIGTNVNGQRGFPGLGGVNLETLRDVGATIIRLQTWAVSSDRISIYVSVYRHLRKEKMQTVRRIVKFSFRRDSKQSQSEFTNRSVVGVVHNGANNSCKYCFSS